MNHMEIDVKFLGGTDIKTAIKEAKELAKKLNVSYICFNFNGTSFSIGQTADIDETIKEYRGKLGGPIIRF